MTLAAVLLLGAALGWAGRARAVTLGGDEATYLALSTSLESGQYRDTFLVGNPPHAKYPPALPAWLLVVRTVAGPDLDVVRAVNLVLLLATALLLGDAVRRLAGPWLGVGAAAVTALNPSLQQLAGIVMGESLYTLLATLALWALVKRAEDDPPPRGLLALAIVAMLLAFLTRTIGVALIAGMGFAFLLQRRWRTVLAIGVPAAVVVLGWAAYSRAAASQSIGRNYGGELAYSASVAHSFSLVAHVMENLRTYLIWTPNGQFGFPNRPDWPVDNAIFAVLLFVPVVAGMVLLLRRWPAAGWYLVLYLGVLLIWPFPDGRLVAPVAPLMAVAAILAIDAAGRRLSGGIGAQAGVVAAAAIAGMGATSRWHHVGEVRSCRDEPPYESPRCNSERERNWMAAANFLRDSIPAGSVVATVQPAPIHRITGHQTIPLERLRPPGGLGMIRPGGPVTHVLLATYGGAALPEDDGTGGHVCERLRVVGVFPPGAMVLEVLPAEAPPNPAACAAMSELNAYVESLVHERGA